MCARVLPRACRRRVQRLTYSMHLPVRRTVWKIVAMNKNTKPATSRPVAAFILLGEGVVASLPPAASLSKAWPSSDSSTDTEKVIMPDGRPVQLYRALRVCEWQGC